MSDLANYVEVQRALQENTPSILDQIPVSAVELSLPLDGRGARIRASVRPNEQTRVPPRVSVEVDGHEVTIPVEAVGDYTEYKAY
ncbi:MAG: hypothetical protein K2X71_00915 [Methylobacterium sp.]|uniref:hypothetical protein n=1 Tax=Methylobacterium sp. TaxID=409 RepID=UPI00258B4E13|nr:hypothetical protein [Methylobacterium sp.]MBY0294590.1 hypothetical protein [Methylobacterium sp.]